MSDAIFLAVGLILGYVAAWFPHRNSSTNDELLSKHYNDMKDLHYNSMNQVTALFNNQLGLFNSTPQPTTIEASDVEEEFKSLMRGGELEDMSSAEE